MPDTPETQSSGNTPKQQERISRREALKLLGVGGLITLACSASRTVEELNQQTRKAERSAKQRELDNIEAAEPNVQETRQAKEKRREEQRKKRAFQIACRIREILSDVPEEYLDERTKAIIASGQFEVSIPEERRFVVEKTQGQGTNIRSSPFREDNLVGKIDDGSLEGAAVRCQVTIAGSVFWGFPLEEVSERIRMQPGREQHVDSYPDPRNLQTGETEMVFVCANNNGKEILASKTD